MGMLGNGADGGGFVPIRTAAATVHTLSTMYPIFGGVSEWEYFNALPGGPADPVPWAEVMYRAMQ